MKDEDADLFELCMSQCSHLFSLWHRSMRYFSSVMMLDNCVLEERENGRRNSSVGIEIGRDYVLGKEKRARERLGEITCMLGKEKRAEERLGEI